MQQKHSQIANCKVSFVSEIFYCHQVPFASNTYMENEKTELRIHI